MRCLTLSEQLCSRGHEVYFACAELAGNIISIIVDRGYQVTRLASVSDISYLDQSPDWIILDHYELNEEYEKNLLTRKLKLFVIDDLGRNHACHGLLDQNFHIKSMYPKTNWEQFLGPSFAILHPSFSRSNKDRSFESVEKIMVFFGGTDPTGETMKFLTGLKNHCYHAQFHLIVGGSNPALSSIKSEINHFTNVTLHVDSREMPRLMEECDFYLGSGGTVTWERCASGLPGVVVATASNQEAISADLAQISVHEYLGPVVDNMTEKYHQSLAKLINNKGQLKLYSQNSLRLRVGQDLERVLDFLTRPC